VEHTYNTHHCLNSSAGWLETGFCHNACNFVNGLVWSLATCFCLKTPEAPTGIIHISLIKSAEKEHEKNQHKEKQLLVF